tara:strand:- start:853 stop:1158 length:306 start_codon:yes stop_codon:yes gene_type:complete
MGHSKIPQKGKRRRRIFIEYIYLFLLPFYIRNIHSYYTISYLLLFIKKKGEGKVVFSQTLKIYFLRNRDYMILSLFKHDFLNHKKEKIWEKDFVSIKKYIL